MWPMSKSTSSKSAERNGQAKRSLDPAKVVRSLLRKRYTKLGPAGDYAQLSTSASMQHSNQELGYGSDGGQGNALAGSVPHKLTASRSVVERAGDVYVDLVWATASHAKIPVIGKPKVPTTRAMNFEKVFGEPHDTKARAIALNNALMEASSRVAKQ